MIADLDETIRKLIKEELPVKNGEIDIKFDQPKREWSSRLTKPTINLFLYDLRENPVLRQPQWEVSTNGGGSRNLASFKRSPMRVDCFYMLTTWANEPEDEHRLLTRAVMALFRFPILPDDRLIGTIQKPPFPIQTRIALHDRLTNPAEVWSALDNEIRPSIPYLVTLALDPWQEFTGPVVRTFTLQTGQADRLPRYKEFSEEAPPSVMNKISGTVRGKTKDGPPLPGVQVAIKNTGFLTTTDEAGRFRLGSVPPGNYTLVVWPEKGKPKEKNIQITMPIQDGNHDLVI
jgi:hypothetical protein